MLPVQIIVGEWLKYISLL